MVGCPGGAPCTVPRLRIGNKISSRRQSHAAVMQGQVLPMLFRLQNSFLRHPSQRLINIHLLACRVKILTGTRITIAATSCKVLRIQRPMTEALLVIVGNSVLSHIKFVVFTRLQKQVNNTPQCTLVRLLFDLNTGPSKVNSYSSLIISSRYYYQEGWNS